MDNLLDNLLEDSLIVPSFRNFVTSLIIMVIYIVYRYLLYREKVELLKRTLRYLIVFFLAVLAFTMITEKNNDVSYGSTILLSFSVLFYTWVKEDELHK